MQFVEAVMPGKAENLEEYTRCLGAWAYLDCAVCRQAQDQLQVLSLQVRLCREIGISSPLHDNCECHQHANAGMSSQV